MSRKSYQISSVTDGKVIILDSTVLKKYKSWSDEYFSCIISEWILNNTELLWFRVRIARIIDQKLIDGEEYAVIEKLKWITIEEVLERSLYPREEIIKIMSRLFFNILESWYLHLDFAPRNLLFSEQDKELWLIDYERGIVNISDINQDELKFLFSFWIFEELSAFLSLDEIKQYFLNLLEIDINNIRFERINEYLMRVLWNRRNWILEKLWNVDFIDRINNLIRINLVMAEMLRWDIWTWAERIEFLDKYSIEWLVAIIYDKLTHA